MREFRIVFAARTNSGESRPLVVDTIARALAVKFGGFTQTESRGGYVMKDGRLNIESVIVFDIATEESAESVLIFADIAADYICNGMEQESVYFRNIDGEVSLL